MRNLAINDKYLAIVKLNVKEYANDEAKIYDNKVLTIEELTVVDRVGLPDAEASSDSTSSAVSSKYIISRFRELVKGDEKKVQLSLKNGANRQTSDDIDELMRSAGIEGDAAEIREDLAELYVKAENLAMDEDARKGKVFIKRVANRIALNMARLGTVRDGETQEAMAERLREEILSRSAFANKNAARKTAKEARGVEREALSLFLLKDTENYTKCKFCIIQGSKIAIF